MFRNLLFIFLAAALAACKVKITVPEGGSVVSESGAHTCDPGGMCDIEVNDIHFDETFVARAAVGYTFQNWKKREKGFCGGKNEPCRLYTSGFAGSTPLLAFLESDDVFHLEPVFVKKSATGTGGSAAQCFNPDRWAQGARLVARYRGELGKFIDYDEVVEGKANFNGYLTTRINRSAESFDPASTWRNLQYIEIDGSKKRLTGRGIETNTFTPEKSKHTLTFIPGRLFRFDLSPGQSYSTGHQLEAKIDLEDLPIEIPELPPGVELPPGFEIPVPGAPIIETSTWALDVTYIGVETVEVPAGSFRVCRFETSNVITISTGMVERPFEISWIGVESGVLIKEDLGGDVTELVSGRLNGKVLGTAPEN